MKALASSTLGFFFNQFRGSSIIRMHYSRIGWCGSFCCCCRRNGSVLLMLPKYYCDVSLLIGMNVLIHSWNLEDRCRSRPHQVQLPKIFVKFQRRFPTVFPTVFPSIIRMTHTHSQSQNPEQKNTRLYASLHSPSSFCCWLCSTQQQYNTSNSSSNWKTNGPGHSIVASIIHNV